MRAALISIGDELLMGDTVNTNASWLGQKLHEVGIEPALVLTVGDGLSEILAALQQCVSHYDVVVMTGGLGPTHDDITKVALLKFFGVGLKRDEESLIRNKAYFSRLDIPFSSSNYAQSDVPENALALQNLQGTAQGMYIREQGTRLFVFPGVPREMKHLTETQMLPVLAEEGVIAGRRHVRYLQTCGIGESTLSDNLLGDLSGFLSERLQLAFLPKSFQVTLRITALADSKEEAETLWMPLIEYIYRQAGEFIYAEGKDVELAESVGRLLASKGKTLGVAESCTGGLLGAMLTDAPGASAFFEGGIISYSNSVKQSALGVSDAHLKEDGAVSAAVAAQMARGVAHRLGTDFGVSITGIAGPDGGSEQKPVGLVWMGVHTPERSYAFHVKLGRDRRNNRHRSALLTLEALRRELLGIEGLPFNLKKIPC